MSITTAEFGMNLRKYFTHAEKKDIYITKNGKVVAKLTNPYQYRVDMAKFLFGILLADITLEEAKEERLNKKIDTCIVIDVLQNRERFSDDAQKIFLSVANKWFVGFLLTKPIADIYYLTHRHNQT